jgi:hypothetical protein
VRNEPISWQKNVMCAHHRWDANTGAKVRAAEAQIDGGAGEDELDQLVRIQAERQRRMVRLNQPPPVVHRLLGPKPVERPPLDPLDAFAEFVRAQHAPNAQPPTPVQAIKQRHPRQAKPHQPGDETRGVAANAIGMPTKTGLYSVW